MTSIATAPVSSRRAAPPSLQAASARQAAAGSSGVANRPVLFSKVGANLTVACTYDYMGRRATKVVTENGQITSSHRFLYRGYLQIACCDRKRANHPCLWLITWDPTQDVATRPLAIQKDGTWYTYGWDLTKNVWEVYGTTGYIRTNYSYSPYGEVAISGDVTQPIQWSSELNDAELGLVYYNYRHYNPVEGRWMGREPLTESIIKPRYVYIRNNPTTSIDIIGLENSPEIPLPTPNQPSQCKPIVYIFIGGARDSKYGPMYDCMLRSLGYCTGVCKTNGTKKCGCQVGPILSDGISVYYHWTSRDAILKDIRGYKRVCPHSRIVLLGHSYGGDTAMDVSERLENITNITLVTLDPVSDFDSYNWSNKRPSNIDYWINAYVGKGVFDLFSPVYGAGQAVSFVGTFLTTFSISNSIASGGGKWGYENAADVNISFPLYGSIRHGDAYELLAPSTGERPIDYLNEFLFPKIQ